MLVHEKPFPNHSAKGEASECVSGASERANRRANGSVFYVDFNRFLPTVRRSRNGERFGIHDSANGRHRRQMFPQGVATVALPNNADWWRFRAKKQTEDEKKRGNEGMRESEKKKRLTRIKK